MVLTLSKLDHSPFDLAASGRRLDSLGKGGKEAEEAEEGEGGGNYVQRVCSCSIGFVEPNFLAEENAHPLRNRPGSSPAQGLRMTRDKAALVLQERNDRR